MFDIDIKGLKGVSLKLFFQRAFLSEPNLFLVFFPARALQRPCLPPLAPGVGQMSSGNG